MLAMQPSGGGFLLCSYQLFLGQAGPGELKMHCVWKGTAPNQETSFLTQGEQWVRAKGQASTHADLDRSCGHQPLPLRSVLLGGGLALNRVPAPEEVLGRWELTGFNEPPTEQVLGPSHPPV